VVLSQQEKWLRRKLIPQPPRRPRDLEARVAIASGLRSPFSLRMKKRAQRRRVPKRDLKCAQNGSTIRMQPISTAGFQPSLVSALWCGQRTQPCGFIHSSTNEFVRPVHDRSFPEVIRQASHREHQQNSNCRIDFVGGIRERHLPYMEAVTQ